MRFFSFLAIIWALLALTPSVSAQNRPAPDKGPSQLYFLSIGIETYTIDSQLPHLYGAENSASIVAKTLLKSGAKHGILLTSKRQKIERNFVVTRNDILKAVIDLKAKIRSDKATTPRIIFYAMGHGGGDPVAQASFLVPGDVFVSKTDLKQSGVAGLIHSTLWNLDIVSSMVNFRSHFSMDYMDDFFPSAGMPNPNDQLGSMMRHVKDQMRRNQIIRERRASKSFLPDGNPPVPYLVLFDNCFGSIKTDLVADAGMFKSVFDNMIGNLINEGVTLYAAQPGENEDTIDTPDWVDGSGIMGPLAARLVDALNKSSPGESLSDFRNKMLNGKAVGPNKDWVPFEHRTRLLPDTALVEILPPKKTNQGTLDVRFGTGN